MRTIRELWPIILFFGTQIFFIGAEIKQSNYAAAWLAAGFTIIYFGGWIELVLVPHFRERGAGKRGAASSARETMIGKAR